VRDHEATERIVERWRELIIVVVVIIIIIIIIIIITIIIIIIIITTPSPNLHDGNTGIRFSY
jgi:lipopolysaccharide/colanic/teichoic acid biosynthesis glycosyltransferase